MSVKTNIELANKAKEIATKYKTIYVMGSFGSPMTAANRKRYSENGYNNLRKSKIAKATADTFGFDCSNLIKGILWGWNGDKSDTYGGAKYATNGVPDINADSMIKACKEVSTNFKDIEVGEALWCSGHIGIYIGDGLAVEATSRWTSKVQITAVGNIGSKTGYNTRTWIKHGKLPYVTYEAKKTANSKKYSGTFPTMPERGYLQKGDKGTQVKNLQKFLNWCITAKLEVDGDFGTKTEKAVKDFQQKYKLVSDGLFGKKSLAKAKTIKK